MAFDIDDFDSVEEINAAFVLLTQKRNQLTVEAAAEQNDRKTRITAAVTALDTLLGPEDGEPGEDSIRAVLRHSDEDMVSNAGLAFRLAYTGLEQLTATVRDIAATIAND